MNKTFNKPEILAPGGDVDAIKAAIAAGADAIYCGLDRFNARNSATNISFDNLHGILRLAHQHNCKIFLTLNIVILENEIPDIFALLNKLANTSIDGIIVQDLGLFYILSTYFNSLKIHASTQCTTHNEGQIAFLSKFGVERLNLSRELNINEIKQLSLISKKHHIYTEVFVHGSNCICFSGICFMSSVQSGNSGNRGRCSQPCRDKYQTTAAGKDYPLNLKDNSAFFELKELIEAGVNSLKIEGRIKKYDYVFTVVDTWRKHLDTYFAKNNVSTDISPLYKVFNRDFSNAFLSGNISKDMFIDSPRDHSIAHLSEINAYTSLEELGQAQLKLYEEKETIKSNVGDIIKEMNFDKIPLNITFYGEIGTPLKMTVVGFHSKIEIHSNSPLTNSGSESLSKKIILKRLKAINDTGYFIKELNLDRIAKGVFLPFKELSSMKLQLLFLLNDSKEITEPADIPILMTKNNAIMETELSILISSMDDLYLCNNTSTKVYFQLPSRFAVDEFVKLFTQNKRLTPWFPAIIIGEDYTNAIYFLQKLNPTHIVSSNTGIGFAASEMGIRWIAGSQLNITNSFSLKCLKEIFNCSGAFISNELNKNQIKNIKCPDNFEIHYSIFHPTLLMTSRPCLFHTTTGCEKDGVDNLCLASCEKISEITNERGETVIIEKSKGNYHNIYSKNKTLNTSIIKDIPNKFSGFLIDLRNTEAATSINIDKHNLISYFENMLNNIDFKLEPNLLYQPSTNEQYKQGL